MSGYNCNTGNDYRPVGSQQNQLTGYTYAGPPSSTYPSTATTSSQNPGSRDLQGYQYGNHQQQYRISGQASSGSMNTSANALNTMSGQQHDNAHQGTHPASGASWSTATYQTYNLNLHLPNRMQRTNSPLYAAQPLTNTHGSGQRQPNYSAQSYQTVRSTATPILMSSPTAYTQPVCTQAQQSQRYNSLLHAFQARQQSHSQQASRSSTHQPPPRVQPVQQASNRQASASVGPQPTAMTVDPSQIYDDRAEHQRQAVIEADRRRKREEQQEAQKAEEERIAAEKRKAEQERQKGENGAAMKKAEADHTAEERKKARAEEPQSNTAAAALQQVAYRSMGLEEPPPADDEDCEMRKMFKKLREFKARNPERLAKLWEEEQKTRNTQRQSPEVTKSTPAATPLPPAPKPAPELATPSNAQSNDSLWSPQKKGSPAAAPLSAVNCTSTQANGPPGASEERVGRPKKEKGAEAVQSTTVDHDTPHFRSLTDAAREIYALPPASGGPVQPPQQAPTPSFAAPPAPTTNGGRPASQSMQPELKPEVKPDGRPRPPANKEEAARKRNFTELIDLTALESDDDDVPPPMKKRFIPPPAPMQQQGLPPAATNLAGSNSLSKPMHANEFYKRPTQPVVPGQGGSHHSVSWHASPQPSRPGSAARPGDPLPPRPIMPERGGLHLSVPWHAGPQPSRPGSAAQSGGPPPPQQQPKPLKAKGPSQESIQYDRIRGKMLVEPIMRDRVARKSRYDPRTIARDVLLATGRHPDMRALNAHLNTMAKILGDHGGSFELDGMRGNRADLLTIRWDIIDPEQPKIEQKKPAADVASMPTADVDADDEDDQPTTAQVVRQAVDNGDGTVSHVAVHEQFHGKPKIKRRGRTPRHSMPEAVSLTNGAGHRTTMPFGGDRHTSTPARPMPAQQTPASAPGGGSGAIGYAAFRQSDNLIKKKGRPFGWRKSVHSKEARGQPSGSTPSEEKIGEPLVEPQYKVYKCQWRNCRSELHNLDTLKKHVVKVHGKPNEQRQYECLWGSCEGAEVHGKGKGRAEDDDTATFPDMQPWIEHVERSHFQPVAWELGDGPRGGTPYDYNAADSGAYLSDAQGRSVTPIVVPDVDRAEATSRVVPVVMRVPGRLPKTTGGMTKDERRAATELEELEKHKKVVGPPMEKHGATFANKKRRLGFMDDEEFFQEVQTEDEHPDEEPEEDREPDVEST